MANLAGAGGIDAGRNVGCAYDCDAVAVKIVCDSCKKNVFLLLGNMFHHIQTDNNAEKAIALKRASLPGDWALECAGRMRRPASTPGSPPRPTRA